MPIEATLKNHYGSVRGRSRHPGGLVHAGRPAEALGYALGMGTLALAAIHQTCALDTFWSFAHPAIY